jgi:hypothetical protein
VLVPRSTFSPVLGIIIIHFSGCIEQLTLTQARPAERIDSARNRTHNLSSMRPKLYQSPLHHRTALSLIEAFILLSFVPCPTCPRQLSHLMYTKRVQSILCRAKGRKGEYTLGVTRENCREPRFSFSMLL